PSRSSSATTSNRRGSVSLPSALLIAISQTETTLRRTSGAEAMALRVAAPRRASSPCHHSQTCVSRSRRREIAGGVSRTRFGTAAFFDDRATTLRRRIRRGFQAEAERRNRRRYAGGHAIGRVRGLPLQHAAERAERLDDPPWQ